MDDNLEIDYLIRIQSADNNASVNLELWSHDTLVETIAGPPENAERVVKRLSDLMTTGKRAFYDFDEIEVGGIKAIPTDDPKKVMSAAYIHGRRHGRKYRCWTLSNGSVRVKRIY